MLKEKPYFILRIEAKDAAVVGKVNGFPVFDKRNLNQLTTELPVNQLIRNGKNIISLLVLPTDGVFKKQNVSLSLYVEKDEQPDTRKLVSQIVFSGAEKNGGESGISQSMPAMQLDSSNEFKRSDSGDIKIETAEIGPAEVFPGVIEITQNAYFETSLPRWKHLDADILEFPVSMVEFKENMDLYNKNILRPLYDFNLEVFEAFKNKDIETISNFMSERNAEMDTALYLEKGSYEKELKDELESDFSWKKPYISDFDKSVPSISDDRKLIKIGVQGMIKLVDKDETVFSYYDMWFYRKDGKWHISR